MCSPGEKIVTGASFSLPGNIFKCNHNIKRVLLLKKIL
jgi:hypothetical protein